MSRTADSIAEVVTSGLCIGCGLCEAVTDGRVRMTMTSYGALRPIPADQFKRQEEALLLAVCPGVSVAARHNDPSNSDPVWGSYSTMQYAWAAQPELRFRAASGGVLTTLGVHLLSSCKVQFVLHVKADPEQAMRSTWTISETTDDVIAGTGSRYGPVAPLAGLKTALSRNEAFAIIAKPCDLNAVHNYSRIDPRIDALCTYRLAMVCGGQSRLEKSKQLLAEFKLDEKDIRLFRYRGFGNPGRTRVETRDGRSFEKTYLELWQDETSWQLETRCKLCPDALGEASDIAAADVWPGGSPVGEDAGFNAIIVRSDAGKSLIESAVNAGELTLGPTISVQELSDCQPHQVRKKHALNARFEARSDYGMPIVQTDNLRLNELDQVCPPAIRSREYNGALARVRDGRFTEPLHDLVAG